MTVFSGPLRLSDGLGDRRIVKDSTHGFLEELDFRPPLAQSAGAELEIEARARRMSAARGVTASVLRVERRDTGVRVVAEHPCGLRLSTLLEHMRRAPGRVPPPAVVHRLRGSLAHGAISPEHAVLTPAGSIVRTAAAVGGALDALGASRLELCRTYGLVLPVSSAVPRFDQRTDVAEMAGVILALALGRQLAYADCASLPELVASVMMPSRPENMEFAARFRAWLYRALQMPWRGMFNSAVDAERALVRIAGEPDRRDLAPVLMLVRQLTGGPAAGVSGRFQSA